MSTTKYLIAFLAVSLIISGCMNSIFTKLQDNQYVAPGKKFEQPVLQTLQMFIGESAAFIFVGINSYNLSRRGSRNGYSAINDAGSSLTLTKPKLPRSKKYILSIPSICDILGTTLMNLGLLYCPVSIYQMMRGALIIFVALFSIFFLKRSISRIEWLALFTVILGITIVGISGDSNSGSSEHGEDHDDPKLVIGIVMILLAQTFTATQFVVEEHILSRWSVEPLIMVGYEGIFGAGITILGMVTLYMLIGINTSGPFDIVNSWKEFTSSSLIIYTSFAIMVSIGLFNLIGITLTSKLSATARSTIDTCRTMLVWAVSLYLGWESFVFLQLVGFCFLVLGTLVFNGAISVDEYLPRWFVADKESVHIIDTIDEQIERA